LLKNWNNNRISGVATAQYLLTKKLSFKSSLNIHYDNDPRLLVTVPDLTFQWVNGIRFDF
jgi:LytS/YehU family sensor histidine kinase